MIFNIVNFIVVQVVFQGVYIAFYIKVFCSIEAEQCFLN